MAQHRLTYDFRRLLQSRDNLAQFLIEQGIEVSNQDTLEQLHQKVKQLVGKTQSERRKWQPDPLWTNIKELCLEDTRNYLYKAAYLISAQNDISEFLEGYGDAFETSDGVFYENVIKPFSHIWDKSKDIIDSNGVPFRWIKLYSNTEINQIPSFYDTVIWAYYDLANYIWGEINNSSTPTNSSISGFGFYGSYALRAIELGNNVTRITVNPGTTTSTNRYTHSEFRTLYALEHFKTNNLERITTVSGATATSPSRYKYLYVLNNCYSLYDLDLNEGITGIGFREAVSSGIYIDLFSGLNSLYYFKLPQGLTKFQVGSTFGLPYLKNLEILDMSIIFTSTSSSADSDSTSKSFGNMNNLEHLKINGSIEENGIRFGTLNIVEDIIILSNMLSFTATGLYRVKEIILPNSMLTLNLSGGSDIGLNNPFLEQIIFPTDLRTLTFTYFTKIKTLTIPASLTSSPILTGCYNLQNINLPVGWSYNLNISSSNQFQREALRNVIESFADRTGQTALVLTIGAKNISKLTSDDLMLAASKNLTIN